MAISIFLWIGQILLILLLSGCGAGAASGASVSTEPETTASEKQTTAQHTASPAAQDQAPDATENLSKMIEGKDIEQAQPDSGIAENPESQPANAEKPAKAEEPLWPTLNPKTAFDPVRGELPTARGPVIESVTPSSIAEAMQIKPGDKIIGINGRRIYSVREFNFIRLSTSPLFMPTGYRPGRWAMASKSDEQSLNAGSSSLTAAVFGANLNGRQKLGEDELLVTFIQNGQVVSALMSHLNPVRDPGFVIKDETDPLTVLRRIGMNPGRNDIQLLADFPQRIIVEANEWLDEDPQNASQAEWLKELASVYLLLCRSDYERVHETVNQPPLPEAKKLAAFYQAIAKQNKQHDFDPDLSAYGQDAEYCALFYPLPEPARAKDKPSLYVYLTARLRPTFFSTRKGYLHARTLLHQHPEWLFVGLQRTSTVWDEQMDLDDLSGDATERRSELFGRLGDLAQFSFTEQDTERLAKLIRDGSGISGFFDCLKRLAYWSHEQTDAPWIVPTLTKLMTVEEAEHWNITLEAFQLIDQKLQDLAAADASVQTVQNAIPELSDELDHLRLMGRIRLIDHLAEAGHKNDAQALADDILLLYKRILSHPDAEERPWPYWHALSVLSNSPFTAKQAVAYGLKYLQLEAPRRQVDSGFLFLAQAYLLSDDLQNAAKMLSRSFSAQPDDLVAYFAGDTLFGNAPAMRLAILHVMKLQPGWSQDLAIQMLRNPSVRVEPAFMEMLKRPAELEPEFGVTKQKPVKVPAEIPELKPDAEMKTNTPESSLIDSGKLQLPAVEPEPVIDAAETMKAVEPEIIPSPAETTIPEPAKPEQTTPAATQAVEDVLDALPLPEEPAQETVVTPATSEITDDKNTTTPSQVTEVPALEALPEPNSAPAPEPELENDLPLPDLKALPELVPLPLPSTSTETEEVKEDQGKTDSSDTIQVPGLTEPLKETNTLTPTTISSEE